MSFLFKDKSWVNRVIFPAPKPALYTVNSFSVRARARPVAAARSRCARPQGRDPARGRLIWIPRRRPQVRGTRQRPCEHCFP